MNIVYQDILGLIKSTDPQKLEDLCRQFPGYEHIFTPQIHFGQETASIFNLNELLVLGSMCRLGLETVLKKCEETMPVLKKRLKNLGNIQLGSQMVVALSGASLLSQASNAMPGLLYITGLLTLSGTLLNLVIQHRSGTILNNNQSIFSLYDKLVDHKLEAEQQLIELDLALKVLDEHRLERLAGIVSAGNTVCLEIKKVLEKI